MLTYGQGHDMELGAHQLNHLALLQRRRPAANHRLALPAQREEVPLQLILQGPVQRLPVHDEDEAPPRIDGRSLRLATTTDL